MVSRTLSSIHVGSEAGWSGASYLSVDVDWAHDDVLADTIDLVEEYHVSATWFVTHNTPLIARLRSRHPSFELGIHPNFNFLLNGDCRAGRDAAEVVDRLMVIVPEAKSVRSHSTTQNSRLLDLFLRRGLTHECNAFIPVQSGISLKPWRLWSNLTRVPYSWEDDVHILYESMGIQQQSPRDIALSVEQGLKVFDFHPIHVFLNTESLDRYERTRPLHHNPKELIKHRYEGYGTRNRLIELLELCKQP
jgi:hypothetical protein